MRIRKEFIIGIIATFTLVGFYWGFSFLKGDDIFSKEREYVLIYDKVAGLNVSNPVSVNGLKIGKVSSVQFLPNDEKARVLVRIKLTNDILIPTNSMAVIKSDFLGVNSIEINMAEFKGTYAQTGDTLKTAVATTIQEEVSMQMLPIKMKAEDMMASLDSVLGAIKYVFNKESQQALTKSFSSIKTTIANLEHTSHGLDVLVTQQKGNMKSIIENVNIISENLKNNSGDIDNIINNFSNLSDSIAKLNLSSTVTKLDKSLNDFQLIANKINSGEGSMGQLINNDTLYMELEAASRELHLLLEDIKLNPNRYIKVSVFGGKNNEPYVNPND